MNLVDPKPVQVGFEAILECVVDNPDHLVYTPEVNWYFASNNSIITNGIASGKNIVFIIVVYFYYVP